MKKIVREFDFSPEQLHEVREAALALGITETTAGILYARGMDDADKMRRFLHPSRENFLSPFLMRGMKEAVELIETARAEEWRVAVFGDYDADGIGALAILSRALLEYGIEPYLYVPEREEGYGLSRRAVDVIFDEFLPDLVITVDCGISCADEVEYIKEQGAFVVVTDHHELPERLPDCICINPKLEDDYPYDNLCGAGVAFKLACALIGEKAYSYLDFCALSTVADSVPLTGENRDLVAEGLKLIRNSPRPAFAALLGKQNEITAQTLSFTLAPRVNAAGRMGDAHAALSLFTTDDEKEIFDLAARLTAYNVERQQLCDELYEKARAELSARGAFGNVVMLALDDRHAGLVGIVAARIAEDYCRPAILFVKKGDVLRGSARSIENVNIYEALKKCSQYLEEFGGHAQAAGVSVKEENFEALRAALDEEIGARYSREEFVPAVSVCGELEGGIPRRLAEELDALEPYGIGNRRPLFAMKAGRLNAAPLKPLSPHLSISCDGVDFMYFGGAADEKLLKSDLEKYLVFECNLSHFRGRESLKGFVRAVVYDGESGEDVALDGFESFVRALGGTRETTELSAAEMNEAIARLDGESAYGTLAVAYDRETLARFPALKALPKEVFRLSSGCGGNGVLLAPDADADLSSYREIFFLDPPAAPFARTGNAACYVCGGDGGAARLADVPLGRDAMIEAFNLLRASEGRPAGETHAQTARLLGGKFPQKRLVFALAVFTELGLVDCSDGRIRIVRGKRTELTNSHVYARALALTGA